MSIPHKLGSMMRIRFEVSVAVCVSMLNIVSLVVYPRTKVLKLLK